MGATVTKPNKPQATLVVCGPQAPSQVSPAPPGAPGGTLPQALPLLCPLASPGSVASFPGFRGWPPRFRGWCMHYPVSAHTVVRSPVPLVCARSDFPSLPGSSSQTRVSPASV